MKYALHPRALAKGYSINDGFFHRTYSAQVEDNDNPGRKTEIHVSTQIDKVLDLTEDESIALGQLMHYIHEAGEHIRFESGYTVNQHTPEGAANMRKILKRAVLLYSGND